ncbi:hypothetical protein AWV80_30360 [Cupriavidus sp. UYMU48A]|nr:hypothetical protein AWV80_30360 [Cupriavidus sp. UYMU48A]
MEAVKILFTTSTGLMSLGVIVFIIGMGWFFARMFSRKMREDAAAAKTQEPRSGVRMNAIDGCSLSARGRGLG